MDPAFSHFVRRTNFSVAPAAAAPAATASPMEDGSASSGGQAGDRKVAQAGASAVSRATPFSTVREAPDSKHAKTAAERIARPLAPAQERLDEERAPGALASSSTSTSTSTSSPARDRQLADRALSGLADQLEEGSLRESSLRARCAEMSEALVRAGTPLGALAAPFPESLQKQCVDRPDRKRAIVRGLVDALVRTHLGESFRSRDAAASVRAHLLSLADLSLQQPDLAWALGEARFSHEADTRRLGLTMDALGQCIRERAPAASAEALRDVAWELTLKTEAGYPKDGGFAFWHQVLAPYFLGSLASDRPEAPVAVVQGALSAISYARHVRQFSGEPGAEASNKLNLDKVSTAITEWAAQSPQEQRNRVHMALVSSLTRPGGFLARKKTDS